MSQVRSERAVIDCYLPVGLINGILCIPRILELNKAKALWLSSLRVVDKLRGNFHTLE